MLRLLAHGPGGLIEQVVVPARVDEKMSLALRDSEGREVLLIAHERHQSNTGDYKASGSSLFSSS